MATGTYANRPGGFAVKTGSQTLTVKQKAQVLTNLQTGTFSPRTCHVGGTAAQVSTDFTNATPSATESYIGEIQIPFPCTVTGVSVFNGTDVTGNTAVALADSTGAIVASSGSVAGSGTDAYQDIVFSTAYVAAPGTYYVIRQQSSATARYNAHTIGRFGASKTTGDTFGTFITITPPTTFTTALAPVATLY